MIFWSLKIKDEIKSDVINPQSACHPGPPVERDARARVRIVRICRALLVGEPPSQRAHHSADQVRTMY